MLEDEQEWRLLLDEAERQGEWTMELQDIEQALQRRLDYLSKMQVEGFEKPTWTDWLECYNALIQVGQAQALKGINEKLNTITERGGSADLLTTILQGIEDGVKR
jgi:hypothetical protein